MPIVGRLDQYGSMIVSGEFNEVGYSTISLGAGQSSFTTSGTYSWTVPNNVVTISVVAVGGGGGGPDIGSGGGGGALAYANDISVTPGEILIVGVGTSGLGANTPGVGLTATDGGNSYVKRGVTSLVEAGGGKHGITATRDAPAGDGGIVIVGFGGTGGAGAPGDTGGGIQGSGGGGAGGYSGAGGQGGQSNFGDASPGSGGGGGGGEGTTDAGSGGGGVGIFGEGASGLPGNGGGGGSGGSQGQPGSAAVGGSGGLYGGGGGSGDGGDVGGYGAPGAVRIIWGVGANRYFPTINTIDFPENYTTVKAGISGLGTYMALEFTENIGITTTLTANVFPPYQIVDDEFAGVLYGPGQGTFMRQNLNGSVVVYNEINEIGLSESYSIAPQSLSINEDGSVTFTISANNVPDGTELYYEIVDPTPSPSIVTSGLVMNLDAGNASSYPGIGITWTDLSGNGNNGTFGASTAAPTYNSANSGYIVFDGSNDYVNIGVGKGVNQFSGDFTVSAWVMADSTGSTFGNIIGDYYTNSIPTTNEWQLMISNGAQISFYRVGTDSIFNIASGYSANTWINVVVSRIGSTISLYTNSNLIATATNSQIFGTATGNLNIGIDGNDTSEPFKGKIANVLIYKDKGLSASEVLQNYNVLKGRYDIVTSGLAMNLDAGNASSYPGIGITWTDLVGGNNATLINGPTYSSVNSGSIVFDGSNDYAITSSSVISSPNSSPLTLEAVCMNTSGSGWQTVLGTHSSFTQIGFNGTTFYFGRNGGGGNLLVSSGATVPINTWCHIIMTYDGSLGYGYLNGSFITSGNIGSNSQTNGVSLLSTFTSASPSEVFAGRIAIARVYNRALSASEVLQNYNALRGRYGL